MQNTYQDLITAVQNKNPAISPKLEGGKKFQMKTDFKPAGDQPEAIKQLVNGANKDQLSQVLLGVTGSGKTFTMAQVIEKTNRPALILAPNKTLAAQLYGEMKSFFPDNAVEYFVSYYDYYTPEAYVPRSDTYIEKEASINEQIDRMRHSATRSLLERDDVIIVSSVSCIYGLGSVKFDFQDNVLNSNNNANNEKIVLFASTHPGEDEILIDAFINLNQEIPSTKLVIVPRHPERANSISSMLNKKNISNYLSYNSSLNFNSESAIVIASIGLLSSLYSQASVAFVGGSLIGSSGGHNIIEPAAAGCPFVVGPYMYNFQDILEEFLNADACIQITEYKEIEQSLKSILTDKDQHEKINALALVRQNKGSSELQANKILQLLKN